MKNAIGYLGCGLLAVFVAYFINASGGVLLLELLTLGFLLSCLIYVLTKKRLRCSISVGSDVANKNEQFELEIRLSSGIFPLPTAMAEITLGTTDNLSVVGSRQISAIVMSKRPTIIKAEVKAVGCTTGSVFIEKCVIHDYLGIAHAEVTRTLGAEPIFIKVLPNIPETGGQKEVLRATAENSSYDEKDEAETNETSLTPTGFPGFEHRDYIPGDSLKRINWKLSTKKEGLLVRLDEKVASSSQVFVLDIPPGDMFGGVYMKNIDTTVEAALAMLDMLVREGFESEFVYYCGGMWKKADIKQYGDVVLLQEDLAQLRAYPKDKRFAHESFGKSTPPVCFSSCMENMPGELAELLENAAGSFVFTKLSGVKKVSANVWLVDDNYEFERLS